MNINAETWIGNHETMQSSQIGEPFKKGSKHIITEVFDDFHVKIKGCDDVLGCGMFRLSNRPHKHNNDTLDFLNEIATTL